MIKDSKTKKEIKVSQRFVRFSPRKISTYKNLIHHQNVLKSMALLKTDKSKGASLLFKILKSGTAAAKEKNLNQDNLIVKNLTINQGPSLKRRFYGSKGKTIPILKRTCHLDLYLEEYNGTES